MVEKEKVELTGAKPAESTPVGDFFAPFFQVAFVAGDTHRVNIDAFIKDKDFTTVRGPSGIDLNIPFGFSSVFIDTETQEKKDKLDLTSQNLSKYAAALQIVSKAQGLREFMLTMTPTYDDAIRIIDSRLIHQGSLVKVRWGYTSAGGINNHLSDVHVFINNEPKVTYTNQDLTITLQGYDLFCAASTNRTRSKQWKSPEAENDAGIITSLLTEVGFNVKNVSKETTPRLFDAWDDKNATTEVKGRIQLENDWTFIRRLCDAGHCWFDVKGKDITFWDLNDVASRTPSYNFVFRKQPKSDIDVPIITFSANGNQRAFLPPTSTQQILITSNPDLKGTKVEVKEPGKDTDRSNVGPLDTDGGAKTGGGSEAEEVRTSIGIVGTAGKVGHTKSKLKKNVTGVIVSGPSTQPRLSAMTKSQRQEAQFYANIQATLTAPGIPNLMGNAIVSVDPQGIGNSFGGPYFVTDVTHNIGTDGYTMRVSLVRTTSTDEPGTPVANKPDKKDPAGPATTAPNSPESTKESFTPLGGGPARG
jgi:phage protein D